MYVAAVACAFPEHEYAQAEITAYLSRLWGDQPELVRRMARLHASCRVERRHLALPLEEYGRLDTFGKRNDAWLAAARALGARALTAAAARAGVDLGRIDALVTTSVTGLAVPSIDARVANELGLREDLVRVPLFGLGCAAGVAALARAAEHVRAHPERVAAVLAIELCSLTFRPDDVSGAHLVATGLFGDGAAAVIVAGERSSERLRGPRVVAARSVLYPDSEDTMGWRISESGFALILDTAVPAMARAHAARDVDHLLRESGLGRADVSAWVCHPGGPKVLEAVRDALELEDRDVAASWASLRRRGNLSSASVLHVLEHALADGALPSGGHALLLALGPGFGSECLLLSNDDGQRTRHDLTGSSRV